MKTIYRMMKMAAVTLLAGVLPVSCINDEDYPDGRTETIGVNTMPMSAVRGKPVSAVSDNTFMVLFWQNNAHLESPSDEALWPSPYLAGHAPQPIEFYEHAVFDTRYPYPDRTSCLYATGYAPGKVLSPDDDKGYRRLSATVRDTEKGRFDFLGCDVWSDVYRGSQDDPFAQDKNRLYFRHLAAKLVFYADRDRNTMENKQYVRNVRVTGLYMSIDGGKTYTSMYTPNVFEWKELTESDFTASYTKTIEAVKLVKGNQGVTSLPKAGYKAVGVMPFAGDDAGFVLQRRASDRVPVSGTYIDSCYVCNNMVDGVVQSSATHQIRLKMDISAEMSFDPDFSMADGDGSTTDDLTFTRTWREVKLDAIYQVDMDGNKTGEIVREFKPGMEYRVYIRFYRTGVNLVAMEHPWNVGGVHYITISGGDRQDTDKNIE